MNKSVMNRRTMIKAMLGGGIGGIIGGCDEETKADKERIDMCDMFELLSSIREVESGDDNSKIGKAGEIGVYQITEIYVDDVNRIMEIKKISWTPYSYSSRLIRAAAQGMMQIYWNHYATPERLGHEPTLEDLARIHNGGPNGWRKESTKKYWKKVEKELKGA